MVYLANSCFPFLTFHNGIGVKEKLFPLFLLKTRTNELNVMDKKGPYSLQALDGPFLMELATI